MLKQDNDFAFNWGLGLGKMLVMMTGGINQKMVPDNFLEEDQAFRNIVEVTIILFVVTVVILLQNLLVGIAVSDVQKLSQEAEISYLAGILENVVMLEAFYGIAIPWINKILNLVGFSTDKFTKTFTVGDHDILTRLLFFRYLLHICTFSERYLSDCFLITMNSSGRKTFMKIDEYPVELQKILADWALENRQSLKIYDETTSEA